MTRVLGHPAGFRKKYALGCLDWRPFASFQQSGSLWAPFKSQAFNFLKCKVEFIANNEIDSYQNILKCDIVMDFIRVLITRN